MTLSEAWQYGFAGALIMAVILLSLLMPFVSRRSYDRGKLHATAKSIDESLRVRKYNRLNAKPIPREKDGKFARRKAG